MSRGILVLAFSLIGSALIGGVAVAQAPAISKPKPAPPGPTTLPPLPPAAIDDKLAMALLGGEIADGDTVRVDVADGGEGLTVVRHDVGEPTPGDLDDLPA